MVQIRKVLGSLGLAMKAGDVVSGEFMTEKSIREGIARLVIVAKDASGNTKKKLQIRVIFTMFLMWSLGTKKC